MHYAASDMGKHGLPLPCKKGARRIWVIQSTMKLINILRQIDKRKMLSSNILLRKHSKQVYASSNTTQFICIPQGQY